MSAPRCLIAEDEPLLAQSLAAELARLWPELEIAGNVGDGTAALERALALCPDVLFLDIRMPGMSGLEVAEALAEDWPVEVERFPLIVFVTAYDQYALEAFDRAAVDYLLKPVQPERLAATCRRLKAALAQRDAADAPTDAFDDVMAKIRALASADARAGREGSPTGKETPLRVIQVGVGQTIRMVRVDDVVYFEAADKYVRVVTADADHLIRTSLRELMPRLDTAKFWQVHRGTVVRADAIDAAMRDESGRMTLAVQGRPERLVVSRLYAHQFKAM